MNLLINLFLNVLSSFSKSLLRGFITVTENSALTSFLVVEMCIGKKPFLSQNLINLEVAPKLAPT